MPALIAAILLIASVVVAAPGDDDGKETPVGTGRVFYISTSGSDSNDGRSKASPWKTVSKVNKQSKACGDTFLFRRGKTWTSSETINFASRSGCSGSPIIYGAYDTGPRPKFTGNWGGSPTGQPLQDRNWIVVDRLHMVGRGETEKTAFRVHGVRNVVISNSVIERMGRACIQVSNDSVNVDLINNRIHDCGLAAHGVPKTCTEECGPLGEANGECVYISKYIGGVIFPATNVRVLNNNIFRCGDEGINLKRGSRNVLVEGNWVHDLEMGSDGGAINLRHVSRSNSPDSVTIRCNRVFNIRKATLKASSKCSLSKIESCARFGSDRATGILLGSVANATITKNIVEDVEDWCFLVKRYDADTFEEAKAKWEKQLASDNTCNRAGDGTVTIRN